ncbi:hypothetical protein [Endozoicomonas sp. 2B-B]
MSAGIRVYSADGTLSMDTSRRNAKPIYEAQAVIGSNDFSISLPFPVSPNMYVTSLVVNSTTATQAIVWLESGVVRVKCRSMTDFEGDKPNGYLRFIVYDY